MGRNVNVPSSKNPWKNLGMLACNGGMEEGLETRGSLHHTRDGGDEVKKRDLKLLNKEKI